MAYPNVPTTLAGLKTQGYRLALVTNKPLGFIQPLLEGLALADHFELCLGGDSLPARKPDPLPLLHACERLGVDALNALNCSSSPVHHQTL